MVLLSRILYGFTKSYSVWYYLVVFCMVLLSRICMVLLSCILYGFTKSYSVWYYLVVFVWFY